MVDDNVKQGGDMPFYQKVFGTLLMICAGIPALATCAGTDLRSELTNVERKQIAERIEDIDYTTGNHWRATRDGRSVHVIGTIHISDDRLAPITERLRGVIETSDLLFLEATDRETDRLKKEMTERPELLFLQDETMPELLPESDWQRLSEAMSARGIPPMIASRFQPWYMSVMLAMPPCLAQDMAEKPQGLDHRLSDIAKDAGVEMLALEPHDTLFSLFDDDPLEEQISVMMLGLDSAGRSEDMLHTLREAYFEQAHAEAWEMSRREIMLTHGETPDRLEDVFSEMEADLLTTRNQAWIPVILDALQGRTQITVAAGAGHLHGPLGVLALLELEGFDLERLPF